MILLKIMVSSARLVESSGKLTAEDIPVPPSKDINDHPVHLVIDLLILIPIHFLAPWSRACKTLATLLTAY